MKTDAMAAARLQAEGVDRRHDAWPGLAPASAAFDAVDPPRRHGVHWAARRRVSGPLCGPHRCHHRLRAVARSGPRMVRRRQRGRAHPGSATARHPPRAIAARTRGPSRRLPRVRGRCIAHPRRLQGPRAPQRRASHPDGRSIAHPRRLRGPKTVLQHPSQPDGRSIAHPSPMPGHQAVQQHLTHPDGRSIAHPSPMPGHQAAQQHPSRPDGRSIAHPRRLRGRDPPGAPDLGHHDRCIDRAWPAGCHRAGGAAFLGLASGTGRHRAGCHRRRHRAGRRFSDAAWIVCRCA